tara:strand:+ start:268 stop:510 length:243 start_codon:yes stop_codon:yes gene_type:complete
MDVVFFWYGFGVNIVCMYGFCIVLYCFVNKYNDFFEYIIVHREKLLLRTVSSLRYISWNVLEIESGMKKEKMSREEEEGR